MAYDPQQMGNALQNMPNYKSVGQTPTSKPAMSTGPQFGAPMPMAASQSAQPMQGAMGAVSNMGQGLNEAPMSPQSFATQQSFGQMHAQNLMNQMQNGGPNTLNNSMPQQMPQLMDQPAVQLRLNANPMPQSIGGAPMQPNNPMPQSIANPYPGPRQNLGMMAGFNSQQPTQGPSVQPQGMSPARGQQFGFGPMAQNRNNGAPMQPNRNSYQAPPRVGGRGNFGFEK